MSPSNSIIVLAGNKSDKEENRQVTFSEAEEFAEKNELLFLETSALTGKNVEQLFSGAAYEILNKIEKGEYDLLNDVND